MATEVSNKENAIKVTVITSRMSTYATLIRAQLNEAVCCVRIGDVYELEDALDNLQDTVKLFREIAWQTAQEA